MNVEDRLRLVREWLADRGLDALVVPTSDPHGSEYLAEHWQCRRWLTGFTGSAGTAVVTGAEALLWTDSRYWIQAEGQLRGTGIRLMREGVDVDVDVWLRENGVTITTATPVDRACVHASSATNTFQGFPMLWIAEDVAPSVVHQYHVHLAPWTCLAEVGGESCCGLARCAAAQQPVENGH